MGAYLYSVSDRSFASELKGQSVRVHIAKFICRSSCPDLEDTQERLGGCSPKSRFFILDPEGDGYHGRIVYCGEGVTCFMDDWELGKTIKPVGMLLEKEGDHYVEVDVMVLEKLRQEDEFRGMNEGIRFMGRFGGNVAHYREYLELQGPGFHRGYAPIR